MKDDEGDPEKAVALALELIERDGVELIQGPVSSASAIALTNIAFENEIILMIDPPLLLSRPAHISTLTCSEPPGPTLMIP